MSLTIGIPHLTAVNCDDLLAAGSGKGAEVAERMGGAGGGGVETEGIVGGGRVGHGRCDLAGADGKGSGKGAEVAERMGEAGGGGDRGKRRPGKSGSA